jgi:site-specific recombinase XerD
VIFQSVNALRRTFDRQRKRTAYKLANPRLKKITFHTLRHWKETSEYHKTKDILHVMQVLGHKNIKNTLLYTQLMTEETSAYTCKIATTPKEILELVEQGYQYVCAMDGNQFFPKPK